MLGIIVNFNMPLNKEIEEEARKNDVEIINTNIIYKIPELLEERRNAIKERMKKELELKGNKPCLIKALKGFFFRQSKPAIFGIEVIEGTLKINTTLMDEKGNIVGKVKSIQEEKVSLKEAEKGKKVAISIDEAILGKNIFEEQLLYSYLDKEIIELWEKSNLLSNEEKEILEKIKEIKRAYKLEKL